MAGAAGTVARFAPFLGGGLCALLLLALGLPVERTEAALARSPIADRALASDTVDTFYESRLAAVDWSDSPDAWASLAAMDILLSMQAYQQGKPEDARLDGVRRAARSALLGAPVQPDMWQRLCEAETLQNGFDELAMEYFRRSFEVGRFIEWLVPQRLKFGLNFHDLMDDDLRRQVESQIGFAAGVMRPADFTDMVIRSGRVELARRNLHDDMDLHRLQIIQRQLDRHDQKMERQKARQDRETPPSGDGGAPQQLNP